MISLKTIEELEEMQAENLEVWSVVSGKADFDPKQIKELWELIEKTEMQIAIAKSEKNK